MLPSRGEDDGQAVLGDVVDRIVEAPERDEQPPGAFEQHDVVLAQQFLRAFGYEAEVYLASVEDGGQMG